MKKDYRRLLLQIRKQISAAEMLQNIRAFLQVLQQSGERSLKHPMGNEVEKSLGTHQAALDLSEGKLGIWHPQNAFSSVILESEEVFHLYMLLASHSDEITKARIRSQGNNRTTEE